MNMTPMAQLNFLRTLLSAALASAGDGGIPPSYTNPLPSTNPTLGARPQASPGAASGGNTFGVDDALRVGSGLLDAWRNFQRQGGSFDPSAWFGGDDEGGGEGGPPPPPDGGDGYGGWGGSDGRPPIESAGGGPDGPGATLGDLGGGGGREASPPPPPPGGGGDEYSAPGPGYEESWG